MSAAESVEDDHADLPVRIEAAGAMNRLSHALVSHRADIDTLRMIGREADRLAAEIEAQPTRDRRAELAKSRKFVQAMMGGSLSDIIEDGAFLDMFKDSPVGGEASPLSMGLKLRRDGDHAVGTVTLRPGWQGAPDRAHGGVVAAIVDETLGGLLPVIGEMAFTGSLTIDYKAPCPMAVPLEFRAWMEDRDGRKLYFRCTGRSDDGVFAESHATFIAVELDRFRAT